MVVARAPRGRLDRARRGAAAPGDGPGSSARPGVAARPSSCSRRGRADPRRRRARARRRARRDRRAGRRGGRRAVARRVDSPAHGPGASGRARPPARDRRRRRRPGRRGRGALRAGPARAPPLARPAAHLRRALGRLPPPGPDRHLRDLLEPRGDAGRARCTRSSATTGSSRATASRRSACCAGCRPSTILSWWRGHPAGWWNPADWNVASICVPIATHVPHAAGLAWGKKLRGERDLRDRVLRRRRHLRGRLPRGRELRRRDARAARPLLQQQPVGDLDAALGADGRRDARRQGGRLRDPRACASTAATCSRSTRRRARPSTRARAGEGPTMIEARHLPRGAARDGRRPERVHRPRARRGGEAARVRRPLRGLPAPARAALGRGRRGGSGRGRGADARRDRRGRGRAAADPSLVFDARATSTRRASLDADLAELRRILGG